MDEQNFSTASLESMGFFDLFKRSTAPAGRVPLAVLCAVAPDGLSSEDGFALRDTIAAARPIDFFFLNPGTFEVFFSGSDGGPKDAATLSASLNALASRRGISPFGVGVHVGPCFAEIDSKGHFTSRPLGETITISMQIARNAASAL